VDQADPMLRPLQARRFFGKAKKSLRVFAAGDPGADSAFGDRLRHDVSKTNNEAVPIG
tara:strand:- start:100 stop:273 length:174 start_codon:yes stop_codon:yes gene_type:complete